MVDWVISELKDEFGKMTINRGKRHTFVGIDIEFNENGTVTLAMDDYIQECISLYEHEIKKKAATPAKGDLFDIDTSDDDVPLSEQAADKFHHTTANLLYAAKRVRIDIDLAVSFLCARVATLTKGDEFKLKRMLAYLQGTKAIKRIIGTEELHYIQTWINTSYAVHRDMRGHLGAIVSMGKGTLMHSCAKQKINTKSSTESEIVGVSDFLPCTIWASYFLKAQGHKLRRNIFYQDNTSAMKMLRNGKESCSSKSRHIYIRYFFTKDILNREEMELKHCTTDNMIADFYTKPLQGKHFYKLRNLIMGHNTMPVEECVENGDKQATSISTKKQVSKKSSRIGINQQYKISSNFD